ncbi:hypothetical protein GCM10028786_33790 [Flaviaesturariibacter terrae]
MTKQAREKHRRGRGCSRSQVAGRGRAHNPPPHGARHPGARAGIFRGYSTAALLPTGPVGVYRDLSGLPATPLPTGTVRAARRFLGLRTALALPTVSSPAQRRNNDSAPSTSIDDTAEYLLMRRKGREEIPYAGVRDDETGRGETLTRPELPLK